MLYDIPINFKIHAENEDKGIDTLLRLIRFAVLEYAMEKEIIDYELFEFIPKDSCESSCCGCGNNNEG